MGKVTGFLEIKREMASRRPVEERLNDWSQVYQDPDDQLVLSGRSVLLRRLAAGLLLGPDLLRELQSKDEVAVLVLDLLRRGPRSGGTDSGERKLTSERLQLDRHLDTASRPRPRQAVELDAQGVLGRVGGQHEAQCTAFAWGGVGLLPDGTGLRSTGYCRRVRKAQQSACVAA